MLFLIGLIVVFIAIIVSFRNRSIHKVYTLSETASALYIVADILSKLEKTPEDKIVVECVNASHIPFFLESIAETIHLSGLNFLAKSQVSRENWRVTVWISDSDMYPGYVKMHGFW